MTKMAEKFAGDGMRQDHGSFTEESIQMVSSRMDRIARYLVIRFLKSYISTGSVILLEEGGQVYTFEGSIKKCPLKVTLRIHDLQFYWKIMTEADIGLADAYINGDISFDDKDYGLQNFLEILILNRDLETSALKSTSKRGWWSPIFLTAGIASATYYMKHVVRRNTISQARRNISQHYDLSNELFSKFMDETMMYSCAVFKTKDEDLFSAQNRKIAVLIKKARIEKNHEVLEIGCGWGGLAVELVRQTGCKYTGITLSKEQLKYAETRAKEAGLQDRMTFLLNDYRQLPAGMRYHRIISCEMVEAVGHEYMEDYFCCVDSALAEDGLFVLQFTSIPDERYEEHRRTSDFMKEYIFPGLCAPSLSRITKAMASTSRLCIEHLENIGIHYYQTLQCWKKDLYEKRSEIKKLGFDDNFIRTWEYYFDYGAAGFKTRTLGNYQVVFSRPGNNSVFNNPYEKFPTA